MGAIEQLANHGQEDSRNKKRRTSSGKPWTERERGILRKAQQRYGSKNWDKIAEELPGRTSKAVERFIQKL